MPIGDAGDLTPVAAASPPAPVRPLPEPKADVAECPPLCEGKASPELGAALAAQAKSSKRCYNTALAQNPKLEASIAVHVRVSESGAPCSVTVDRSPDPMLDACVVGVFEKGVYPKVSGGCIDVNVPIRFRIPTP